LAHKSTLPWIQKYRYKTAPNYIQASQSHFTSQKQTENPEVYSRFPLKGSYKKSYPISRITHCYLSEFPFKELSHKIWEGGGGKQSHPQSSTQMEVLHTIECSQVLQGDNLWHCHNYSSAIHTGMGRPQPQQPVCHSNHPLRCHNSFKWHFSLGF
jgi:hypothetical protein